MSQAAKPKKSGFKMPHLLFLMLGLICFMCLMTFLIPAGEFQKDEAGNLMGDNFQFVGAQSPVNPWQALLMMLQGLQNSSLTISLLLIGGGTIGIILDTGAIDEMMNWAIYKLQDKGLAVLLPVVFFLMGILGAFGGGDQLVALVPVGVIFAKKLRLDPIMAAAVTFYALMIGFSTGPTKLMIPQLMMEVPIYSGFGYRSIVMLVAIFVGMFFTVRYAQKITKDPSKSAMGNTDWLAEMGDVGEIKAYEFSPKATLVVFLFFAQYAVIVVGMLAFKQTNALMIAVQLPVSIICGLIYGMSTDQIGRSFAKGVGGMAFVGVVIGFAGTMSLVMNTGKILHTVVYYATLPLKGLGKGFAAIGISCVIMFINVFVPSASAKAAILFPIVKPMSEALGLSPQVAVSSFQFGDGFTNMITPALGWTVGSLEIAKVPYDKWLKWALPSVLVLTVVCWAFLYHMSITDWMGF